MSSGELQWSDDKPWYDDESVSIAWRVAWRVREYGIEATSVDILMHGCFILTAKNITIDPETLNILLEDLDTEVRLPYTVKCIQSRIQKDYKAMGI